MSAATDAAAFAPALKRDVSSASAILGPCPLASTSPYENCVSFLRTETASSKMLPTATELSLRLRALTGVALSPTIVFEQPTPRAVAVISGGLHVGSLARWYMDCGQLCAVRQEMVAVVWRVRFGGWLHHRATRVRTEVATICERRMCGQKQRKLLRCLGSVNGPL